MLPKHRCLIEEVKHSNAEGGPDHRHPGAGHDAPPARVDPKVITGDFESTEVYPLDKQNVYRLFYQMTRITNDRGSLAKDDRLDVSRWPWPTGTRAWPGTKPRSRPSTTPRCRTSSYGSHGELPWAR